VDHPRRAADPHQPTRVDQATWAQDPVQAGESTQSFPVGDTDWVAGPVEPVDDDLDLLAEVNHRPGRATGLLIAAIVVALAFIGGVAVQKQFATGTAAVGPGAGFAGRPGGNAGGYGGFGMAGGPGGAQPGGAAAGGPAAGGAGAGGGGAAAAGGATPVVVGTVTMLSGSTLTVKNLGGKSVTVKVPSGATITLVAGKRLTTLKRGATVSVAGKAAADGTVTATSVTVRS
jgi:uncharacterized protein DUF5666